MYRSFRDLLSKLLKKLMQETKSAHGLILLLHWARRLMTMYFCFNDTATTEIYTLSYTLSLLDALPIFFVPISDRPAFAINFPKNPAIVQNIRKRSEEHTSELQSHSEISYAVFCLK